jgi:hypothetical protein
MNRYLLTAVSGIALLAAAPIASAETPGNAGAPVNLVQLKQKTAAAAGYVSYNDNKKALTAKLAGGATAEKLIGADIVSPGGDSVGEIDDLLIDKNGRASNVVVDVGSFLGMGGKNVVLDLKALTPAKGSDGDLVTNMNKDQLKALPEYEKKNGVWVMKPASGG